MNFQKNSPRRHFMKSIPNLNSHAKIVVLFCTVVFLIITPTAQGGSGRRNPLFSSKLSSSSSSTSKYYETEDDEQKTFLGRGRELNLFDNRGGDSTATSTTSSSSFPNSNDALSSGQQHQQQPSSWPYKNTGYYNRKRKSIENYKQQRSNYYKSSSSPRSSSSSSSKSILSSIKEWIQNGNLPKIQCRVEPNTTLKVRKTFRPLKTVVRLGADFNTQLGVWQFKSSWEDDVIGGKLTLAGRELQFSKTWLLSVGEYYNEF